VVAVVVVVVGMLEVAVGLVVEVVAAFPLPPVPFSSSSVILLVLLLGVVVLASRNGFSPKEMRSALDSSMDNSMIFGLDII
jgi:hypothetical protein